MGLPSFERAIRNGMWIKPRIQVLEVHDREKQERVLHRILVERVETYAPTDSCTAATSASIRLTYFRLTGERYSGLGAQSWFSAWYDRHLNEISLTGGAVFLDSALHGHHVGTYLQNEIVLWAKQWPDATVKPISVSSVDDKGVNKERRNRFYEQFGIIFDYTQGTDRACGRSRPMPASALTPVTADMWKADISEHDTFDYVNALVARRNRDAADIVRLERVNAEHWEALKKAYERPLRWAVQRWFLLNKPYLVVLLLLAVAFVSARREW